MKKQPATEKLLKMLRLIPLLHSNRGISLKELERIGNFSSPKELNQALERLIMFGAPPFTPSDFIDLYIDEEGKVFLESSQGLDRPLALESEEWRALEKVIRDLEYFQDSGDQGFDQASALLERISGIPVRYSGGTPYERTRGLLEEALEEKLQIEFLYRSPSSKIPEKRRVDPWALFLHRGSAYMIGFCHLRKASRMFHLERMEDPAILEMELETENPPELHDLIQNSPLFQKSTGFPVELEFHPSLTTSLDYHFGFMEPPVKTPGSSLLKGSIRVRESVGARTLLRAFGPGIRIGSPEHFRQSYLEELEEIPVPVPL